jgi:hypothetical protein
MGNWRMEEQHVPVVTAWRQDGEFCVGSPSAFSDGKSRSVSEAPALEKQRAGDSSDSCKLNNYILL